MSVAKLNLWKLYIKNAAGVWRESYPIKSPLHPLKFFLLPVTITIGALFKSIIDYCTRKSLTTNDYDVTVTILQKIKTEDQIKKLMDVTSGNLESLQISSRSSKALLKTIDQKHTDETKKEPEKCKQAMLKFFRNPNNNGKRMQRTITKIAREYLEDNDTQSIKGETLPIKARVK